MTKDSESAFERSIRDREVVYSRSTAVGKVWILSGLDERWHIIWDGEDLGGYASAAEAAARIAESKLATIFGGEIESYLPSNLSKWTSDFPARRNE